MAEGSMWEAFEHAAFYELENLTAIIDVNRLGQRGETMHGWDLNSYAKRAEAFGWKAIEIEGHDLEEIDRAYQEALHTHGQPTVIVAHTLKGKGVKEVENQLNWHGKALDHPDKISGLALISPLTQPQDSVPAAFRGIAIGSPAIRRAVALTLATPVGLLSGTRGAVAVFAPEPVPADFATLGGGQLVLRPGNFHAASTDLAAARADMAALAARYGDLAVPVAILFGRGDQILDPAIHGARIATDVPRVELTLIDGGHMIPVTASEAVAHWIRGRIGAA
jgi:hypothetical protein